MSTPLQVEPAHHTVLARASWPTAVADELPAIAGFVISTFSPLVAEVADRCLRARHGTAPVDPVLGERTGVVLASVRGDVTTARTATEAVRAGTRVPPLLFFQSNPNAVVGHVTARWGLGGPVVCTSPPRDTDPLTDGLAAAELLLADGDATEVLVIAADLARAAGEGDHAVAVVIGPAHQIADEGFHR